MLTSHTFPKNSFQNKGCFWVLTEKSEQRTRLCTPNLHKRLQRSGAHLQSMPTYEKLIEDISLSVKRYI